MGFKVLNLYLSLEVLENFLLIREMFIVFVVGFKFELMFVRFILLI